MQQTPVLLDGYINLIDASRERGMPSLRTLQRMALEGELPDRAGRAQPLHERREIPRDPACRHSRRINAKRRPAVEEGRRRVL